MRAIVQKTLGVCLFFCLCVSAVALGDAADPVQAFNGRPMGILTGSIMDAMTVELFPDSALQYYATFTDEVTALKTNKIDGFLADEPIARDICAKNADLGVLSETIAPDAYGFAFPFDGEALCEQMSAYVKQFASDGTTARLDTKWFSGDDATQVPEDVALTGENGTIKLLTNSTTPPFSFVKNGEIVGYDIDMVRLIAAELGYGLEVVDMDFGAIIPALTTGRGDMAAACISITEERKKAVLFAEPNYVGGVVLVARASDPALAGADGHVPVLQKKSFAEKFRDGFLSTFVAENRWQMLLRGLGTTLLISALSALFGTALGAVVCLLRRSRKRALAMISGWYVQVMQGTPVLVVMMILYFVVFAGLDIDPMPVAVLAFSLNMAAYVCEMLSAAIDAVDKGQIEAATASGFTVARAYRHIVLPQAIKHALPVYKGEIISMVKMTSIVGYIAIMDLTRMSDLIRSRTYEAFFPLITTAVVYFLISLGLVRLLSRLQSRVDPKRRARVVKGVRM